jgi:hypothetical protein
MRDDIAAWLTTALKPGPFSPPGLVVAINDDVTIAGVDGAGVPLTREAIWPLACLTKLALADTAVRVLDLDRPITSWLPEVGWPFTVRQLLTHTSGLPLDLPIDEYGTLEADDVRDRMLRAQPIQPSGTMSYSNIGYGWLSVAIERVTGRSLTQILWSYDLVWGDTLTRPAVTIADVRSPLPHLEPYNSAYWRSLRLPWCGAFGTLDAVRQLITRLHPLVTAPPLHVPGGFPPGAYLGFAPSNGCLWDDAAWGCGVEFRAAKAPHWITPKAAPDSFGHVASSGVMVWKDGATTLVVAGARTTDGGWILRHGPKASAFAFTPSPSHAHQ